MANLARRTQSRKPIPLVAAGAACLVLIIATACVVLAQEAAQPTYTIHARVPLTIVDVVVTDSKGHPVHGLKQSDFTLLEDKTPMKLNSFDEHRSDLPDETATTLIKQQLPANTFTNVAPTPTDRPINILMIDSLNTMIMTQTIVQRHMIEFVDKLAPGARLAVFSLSAEGRLAVLQGFTADHALLKAAINNKSITGQIPELEDTGQDPTLSPNPDPNQENECNRAAARGQYSMTAMNQMARYLSGMPGRKNLVWMAGSFPLTMIGAAGIPCYDFTEDLKSATDSLARAHVALYPVDPRALDILAKYGGKPNARIVQEQVEEHLTMESVAEQTGGKALYNNNDLGTLAADAVDSGSNFYTLTYAPVNQTLDTRFRSISVKVDQPGLHLVYRDGYYAIDPGTTLAGAKVQKVSPMQSAMMRGGLNATQILFKVKVSQAPGTEVGLPVSNQPDAKLMKPPYRHYTISYDIDVHGIEFNPSPDGNYRGDFEYGVRVYNADGDEVMNSASKTVSPILPPAVYKSMLNGGANAHLDIDVPATGNYFLRIAVHDLSSDRVGAIEIPISSVTPDPAPSVAAIK